MKKQHTKSERTRSERFAPDFFSKFDNYPHFSKFDNYPPTHVDSQIIEFSLQTFRQLAGIFKISFGVLEISQGITDSCTGLSTRNIVRERWRKKVCGCGREKANETETVLERGDKDRGEDMRCFRPPLEPAQILSPVLYCVCFYLSPHSVLFFCFCISRLLLVTSSN